MDTTPSKTCFVIMPISNQLNYPDNHFTLVYEDIIRPAIEKAELTAVRADETVNTNLIQVDILKKVIESEIAICDMSAKNPNVFYELGLRQAFDLPTVLMVDDKTETPFDVSGLRYVTYKKDMKYRDVNSAIEELSLSLCQTYKKRADKSEINSLIRLLELTNPSPAKLDQTNATFEEKIFMKLEQLSNSIDNVQTKVRDIKRNAPSVFNNEGYTDLDLENAIIKRDIFLNKTAKQTVELMAEQIANKCTQQFKVKEDK